MARLTILSALLLAGTSVAAGRRLQQEVAVECPESVLGCSACATTGTTLRCKACTTNAYMDAGGHCSECLSARLVRRGGSILKQRLEARVALRDKAARMALQHASGALNSRSRLGLA